MIRILFIARYRDATMDRNIALMAQEGGLAIWQIKPSSWWKSVHYFWRAMRVSPNPWLTPFRIVHQVVFYNFLRQTHFGTYLVRRAVRWRREQINIGKKAVTPSK